MYVGGCKQDLALNYPQELICYKTPTKKVDIINGIYIYIYIYILELISVARQYLPVAGIETWLT